MNDEKKKVKQAVALEYDPSDEAPRVIASGKGILAEKIIEKAQESSVPIHRDDKLAGYTVPAGHRRDDPAGVV